jgi:exodeoxyribonuclease V alpha subunit
MNAVVHEAEIGALVARVLAAKATGGDRNLLTATVRTLFGERAGGHVCLALADWQRRPTADGAAAFPELGAWRADLLASGVCEPASAGEPRAPLVLDDAHRLYLRRDFAAERTIAASIRARVRAPDRMSPAALAQHLAALGLAAPANGGIDWQLAAIAAAARGSFSLLTGGPGTGKTTTIARLLAVLLREQVDLRVALCAPTGKAASRLHAALRARAAEEPALQAAAERCQPTTLHRLLGYLPFVDRFRVDANNPLRHDVVVVDEASMADPALLAVLCRALPEAARLVLVGDRDQLAAVAAGQVLGDVCRAAAAEHGTTTGLAQYVQAATGMVLPARTAAPAIAGCVVHLRTNYRFAASLGIGAFAQSLAQRDANGAFAVLHAGHEDLVIAVDADDAMCRLDDALAFAANGPADAVAARLARVRILTATRHGPNGSLAWNARVEAWLERHGVRAQDPWYEGRPILVTQNDHQSHVYNGDLGVVVRDADGRPQVAFPLGDGSLRRLPPLRLPAHETAWAMTVHKAQGSEFDEVLLAMPDRPGPSWQAPLLYTGITRARTRAILLADDALLVPALANWPARSSGLADALTAI